MNKIILIIIVILIVVAGIYFLMPKNNSVNNNMNNNIKEIQGMKVEILQQGSGEAAKSGDTVSVNYTGMLTNGTKFDSNVDPAFNHVEPFPFTIDDNVRPVIKGWNLGVVGMKVGEKRKLTIPPELAYGDRAVGNLIPANSTLIFEVELLKIN